MNTLETTLHLILAELQYQNDMAAAALATDARENRDNDLLISLAKAKESCYSKYGNASIRGLRP